MKKIPIGVKILCLYIGFISLLLFIIGFSQLGIINEISSDAPVSVRLFVRVFPIVSILWGAIGLFAVVKLLQGTPAGRTAGLVWTGLGIAGELFFMVWGATGPTAVRAAIGDPSLLRLAVSAGIFAYLWWNVRWYVEGRFVGSSPDRRPWE